MMKIQYSSRATLHGIGRQNSNRRNLTTKNRNGFSLIELLTVMAIIAILSALSGLAITSLHKAGAVTRASSDLVGVLELSRVYAMTHSTYVRVGLSETPTGDTVVFPVYAVNGSLGPVMTDSSQWPLVSKALILKEFKINDAIDGTTGPVTTSTDEVPSSTNIPSFERKVPGVEEPVEFASIIQFNPNGEARVIQETTARYIKIGMTRDSAGDDQNPFIVRLSGTSGFVDILRKEDGI
jgi:prepilin-type N-terminal cleavage/methylation domain-containing protein